MFPSRALGALTAAVLLAGAASARAAGAPDAGTVLSQKVDDAIAGATSYRVLVLGPEGLTIDVRTFGPERLRVVSTLGSESTESIVVGTAMYYRRANEAWKAAAVPALTHVRRNRLYMGAPDTALSPLDDRTESGTVVGAFRSPAAVNANLTGTMDCTYDKATFRPRACTISVNGIAKPVQVTYDRWDDPTNVVEPPPGVPPPTPSPVPAPTRGPAIPGAPH